jgi:hypothetical protein
MIDAVKYMLPVLVLISPFSGFSQTTEKSFGDLQQRVSKLEMRLDALESIPPIAVALKLKTTLNANPTPLPTPQKDAPLVMTDDWSYDFHDAQYDMDKRHVITYTLKNETDKAIKLVDAFIILSDRLGQEILTVRLLRDVLYPPGVPSPQTGKWSVNSWKAEEARMRILNHDDVIPSLIVRKVLFVDNTTWSDEGAQ